MILATGSFRWWCSSSCWTSCACVPARPSCECSLTGAGEHSLLTATGVHPEGSWDIGDADLVDLVPRDLPTVAALDLLGSLDPAKYRADRWARGASASQAVSGAQGLRGRDRSATTRRSSWRSCVGVKDHVRAEVDIAVAPGLKAGPYDVGYRAATLRQLGKRPSLWIAGSVIGYATVAAAVITAGRGA